MTHDDDGAACCRDDPAAREGLELALRRLGYRVRCAVTGEAALDGFSGAAADVVVLDLMLPGAGRLRGVPAPAVPGSVFTCR